MFQRFVSASAVGSILIALGSIVLLLMPPATQERIHLLTVAWCFVPSAWGLWAMVAPAAWVPQRLPVWGAILGVVAGVMAVFVLDLPARFSGQPLPVILRGAGVVIAVVFYYLFWMLVRAAHRALAAPAANAPARES